MLSLSRFQTLRSLRHRNFRLMVIGALLSNAGDFMQNVAQSWPVWHLTRFFWASSVSSIASRVYSSALSAVPSQIASIGDGCSFLRSFSA
jgi:hypothetical protein